jgi:hypothetical protein
VVEGFRGIAPIGIVKTLYNFNFDVLGDIGKWFAQVLALNTIYSIYKSGGGGEK